MPPLLFLLVFAAAPADCTPLAAWNAGRAGVTAAIACPEPDYREAHRLGLALHALRRERDALEVQAVQAAPGARGALRRRQRQLDTDLEAIRGLATIKGWPLDLAQEPLR
jgi:hypothetical protein